jgi:hypothetical protein
MVEESSDYKTIPAPAEPTAVSEVGGAAGDPDAIGTLTARVTELAGQLTAKDTELSEAKRILESQAQDFGVIKMGYDGAVTAYRKLAVSSNPLFSEELITGSTIAEVDASIKKVNDLAAGIKTRLEAELKAIVIPAGAPERSGPDTSGMSPREKIKAGIQNK